MAIEEWRKCREIVQKGGYLQTKQITPLCYLFLCELALAAWKGERKTVMTMEKASELLGCNPTSIIVLRKRLEAAGLIEVERVYPNPKSPCTNTHRLLFLDYFDY